MVARAFLLATLAVGGTPLTLGDEKVEAVVDYVRGDTLYVDGQRIVLQGNTRYKGARPEGAASVPPGTWARAKGPREASGAILATEVELRAANPNESHEAEIKAACDQAEKAWVSKGMMYMPADSGKIHKIGDLVTSGPYVVRARKIMDKLRPSYVGRNDLRVHIVRTKDWNASAMANGAIWVYTGLMDDFDDDELAILRARDQQSAIVGAEVDRGIAARSCEMGRTRGGVRPVSSFRRRPRSRTWPRRSP